MIRYGGPGAGVAGKLRAESGDRCFLRPNLGLHALSACQLFNNRRRD